MPTPLNIFQYRMPSGFPGDVQRIEAATIVAEVIDSAAFPTAFGVPIKMVAGKIQPIAAADTAASVYGFNVRPYPIQGNGTDPMGTSTPPTSGITDILKRGFIMAALNGATAATKNGSVYMRVANPVTGKPIGGIEAASDIGATSAPGANTGNGTMGTLSATNAAVPGAYKVVFSAATVFSVTDPNGNVLKTGATGAAYSAGGVTFTITAGGTAFVATDSFTVTVAPNTVQLPNAYFNGVADAYDSVEVAYNL